MAPEIKKKKKKNKTALERKTKKITREKKIKKKKFRGITPHLALAGDGRPSPLPASTQIAAGPQNTQAIRTYCSHTDGNRPRRAAGRRKFHFSAKSFTQKVSLFQKSFTAHPMPRPIAVVLKFE
jgi:hypothetical protein